MDSFRDSSGTLLHDLEALFEDINELHVVVQGELLVFPHKRWIDFETDRFQVLCRGRFYCFF